MLSLGHDLVTADIANSYNREVFAVPGRATDSLSKGCNELIKIQKAQLFQKEFLRVMGSRHTEEK